MTTPLRLCFLCIALLTLTQPTLAVELANDHVAFRFDADAGYGLVGMTDRATGREILDPRGQGAGAATLWEVVLADTDLQKMSVNNQAGGRVSHRLTRDGDTQRLQILWQGVPVPDEGGTIDVRADIVLPDDTPRAKWHLHVTAHHPARWIWMTAYPSVRGVQDLGDDYLAVPHYIGKIVWDPTRRLTDATFFHPGKFSMQFVAAWGSEQLELTPPPAGKSFRVHGWVRGPANDETGLYMAAEDGQGWNKQLRVSRSPDAPFVHLRIEHYPQLEAWPLSERSRGPMEYELPYAMVLGTFEGGAEAAAAIYRDWALQQEWARRGPIWNPTGPTWTHISEQIRQTVFWGKFYHEPNKVVPELAAYRAFLRVPMTTHFYRYYISRFDDNNPEYLPADPYFRQAVRDLRRLGVAVMPYINGSNWDMNTEAWREADAERGAALDADGKIYDWVLAGNQPHAWMDPSAPMWQQKINDVGQALVGDYGVNGLYLDVLPAGGKLSYNTALHKPHGGTYWSQGNRELVTTLRQNLQTLQPDALFTGEAVSENYIDLLDAFLTLDVSRYGWKTRTAYDNFPLFAMVYHDHAITFGSDCMPQMPIDAFAWQMGLNFVWGSQLMYSHALIPEPDAYPQTSAYLRETTRAFHQVARKFLTGGQWVQTALVPEASLAGRALVSVVSPEHRVSAEVIGAEFPWIGPAVLASTWQAHDGTLGIVLTNIASEAVTAQLTLDAQRLGVQGQPLWQLWPLPVAAAGRVADATLTRAIDMPARSVVVLQMGGATAPAAEPLEDVSWHLARVDAEGAFSPHHIEDRTLWAAADTLVHNAVADGNTLTLLAATPTGTQPRRAERVLTWNPRLEGQGLPRDPGDKPFYLLTPTPLHIAGDAAVEVTVQGGHGSTFAEFEAKGAFEVAGPEGVVLLYRAEPSGPVRATRGSVALPAGRSVIAGISLDTIAAMAEAAGVPRSAMRHLLAMGEPSTDPLKAVSLLSFEARELAQEMSRQPRSKAAHDLAEALTEAAHAAVRVATGARVGVTLENDWLVPAMPLSIDAYVASTASEPVQLNALALSVDDAEMADAVAVNSKMVSESTITLDKPAQARFTVATATNAVTERVLPLTLWAELRSQGMTFATGKALWLSVDRPLIVQSRNAVLIGRPGATLQAEVHVRNVSPYLLKVEASADLPEGWRVAPEAELAQEVRPAAWGEVFKVPVQVAENVSADQVALDMFFRYAGDDRTRVHEGFTVNMLPTLVPTAQATAEAGAWVSPQFRYGSQVVLHAKAGETVTAEIVSLRLAGRERVLSYTLYDAQLRVLAEGEVPAGETRPIHFEAPATGCYYLDLTTPGLGKVTVQSPTPAGFLASPLFPLPLFEEAPPLYFFVPEGARAFQIRLEDGGVWEPVEARVFLPDGTEAITKAGPWDTAWVTVRVPERAAGRVWRLEIAPTQDVQVQLQGDVVPSLSPTPGTVLRRPLEKPVH